MTKETGREALKEIKQIFKELKIVFFLNYGTALGIYRDGDFLPDDYDIDIGVFGMDKQAQIEEAFIKRGWQIRTVGRRKWLHVPLRRGDVMIDILLYEIEGDHWRCWVKRDQPWMTFPSRFNSYQRIKFDGEWYNLLSPIEEWLECIYTHMWWDKDIRRSANQR